MEVARKKSASEAEAPAKKKKHQSKPNAMNPMFELMQRRAGLK